MGRGKASSRVITPKKGSGSPKGKAINKKIGSDGIRTGARP